MLPAHIELQQPTMTTATPDDEAAALLEQPKDTRSLFVKLGASFFVFGLINNVLYVIILSAALDLVPPSTPKGIIAFCNIAPALVAKVGWPYLLKGRIRYMKRLIGCCVLAVLGMVVVAAFDTLLPRLLGICLASFASGLGELTFLQLSTTYHPHSVCGHAVGYFASGTGAAGIVGAGLWWLLRSLGVRLGVGLSAVLPFVTPVVYLVVLPRQEVFAGINDDSTWEEPATTAEYAPVPTADPSDVFPAPAERESSSASEKVSLSLEDKWRLVRPLLFKYMLPLFCVYTLEYTINQGIAPTLVYPVPEPATHPILRHVIVSMRDFYPLWQLVYQTSVFLSRSSISLGIPPLPARLLPLPAIVQAFILAILALESGLGLFADNSDVSIPLFLIFVLISAEGICGGLAYVNVFYRVGQEPQAERSERARQEREFKIGSIGFADSLGILTASLLAVPTEVGLCNAQAARGRMLCKEL
ncbi:batten's disease protein Cln3 [Exidia glandulosa HHB12029]|uniref:Protein BTN n=1 Tax=Exidia glandulosa HHB12029 TaxID=1314781 RepID=A0A165K918_EXIGL|nr:batten's disease protein Cln3 [Exidia glandulosa HHB12029]